jgi:S-adenosylmethionine:tRNA ribosyltransferase-isomerase
MTAPLRVADFDYALPRDLIAQAPALHRDGSRLLVLDRGTAALRHRVFRDLPSLLAPGDLLVVNDARVIPARLDGLSDRSRRVEILLIQEVEPGHWEVFVKPSRTVRVADRLVLADGAIEARVTEKRGEGRHVLRLVHEESLFDLLGRVGRMPLPPYIRRPRDGIAGLAPERRGAHVAPFNPDLDRLDVERYQTVYARHDEAIAAPTAGLHFTPALIHALLSRGIEWVSMTLSIGPGTFRPVRSDRVEAHRMEAERYVIPEETALAIKAARSEGRRVVAVGTTTVRALEHAAADGAVRAGAGLADLFIYPGHRFRIIDALITNFHLPRSTLLMLVSAFAGREAVLSAYREAVAGRYRFYSYGDAMLIT